MRAVIVGGDIELSRTDRPATADELAKIAGFGEVAVVIDTNVRAKSPANDAFVDLVSVSEAYPLVGTVVSEGPPDGIELSEFLAAR